MYFFGKANFYSIALRFHHQLVKIHCFPNGNGRHSRLMTDILLTDVLDKEPFTWGNGNLSVEGGVRDRFINALKNYTDSESGGRTQAPAACGGVVH